MRCPLGCDVELAPGAARCSRCGADLRAFRRLSGLVGWHFNRAIELWPSDLPTALAHAVTAAALEPNDADAVALVFVLACRAGFAGLAEEYRAKLESLDRCHPALDLDRQTEQEA